jgi:diguanylate cyclase (GGDEF)-like protein/PAS domain S-box-containing protein
MGAAQYLHEAQGPIITNQNSFFQHFINSESRRRVRFSLKMPKLEASCALSWMDQKAALSMSSTAAVPSDTSRLADSHKRETSQRILAERVALLFQLSLVSVRGVLVTCVVLGVVLWLPVPRLPLWLMYMGAMLAARFALYRAYCSTQPALSDTRRWVAWFIAGSAAHGIGWGLLGTAFFPHDELYQSIIIFTICGTAAAGIATLAPMRQAYTAFLLPALLPLACQMVFLGGAVYYSTAFLLCLLLLYLLVAARQISDSMGQTYQARFEKEGLLKNLTVAKQEVENYNRGLQEEIVERKKIQEALRESENHYRRLVETSSDLIWSVDRRGCFSYVNRQAVERIYGCAAEEMLGRSFSTFDIATQHRLEVAAAGVDRLQFDTIHRRKDGAEVFLSFQAVILRDEDGHFIGATGTASDITARKLAEERLNDMLDEHQVILEHTQVGIAFIKQNVIARCNRKFEEMFGYGDGELAGRSPAVLYPSAETFTEADAASMALARGTTWEADFPVKRKDGSSFWCQSSVKALDSLDLEKGSIWVFSDVTERRQREELVRHLAHHDALTALPNRTLLRDRLEQTLIQARRTEHRVAVLFLDLDRFKLVNDTFGHEAGDSLLQAVASRLKLCVREGDTVSRPGGDEFLIVLAHLKHPAGAERVAQKIRNALTEPVQVGGHEFHVAASIGISIFPDDAEDTRTLLKQADIAMYHAKEQGRNSYSFFTQEMNARSTERLLLESSLRRAMEKNEFSLCYQPRHSVDNGRINGVEALVRWQHPDLGLIAPPRFIHIAEETGLIVQLGQWVLETACAQTKKWQQAGHPNLRVSVNLSPRQLQERSFGRSVASLLQRLDFPPNCLELEITESMLARNPKQTVELLTELEAQGVELAIDDFGTGYSSLSQLKRFPVHTLKIDRAFIDGLPDDADDTAITLAIIAMAKRLQLKVVAEGVEKREQLAFLKSHGCDEVQGYLLNMPLSVAEMEAVLAKAGTTANEKRTEFPSSPSLPFRQRIA